MRSLSRLILLVALLSAQIAPASPFKTHIFRKGPTLRAPNYDTTFGTDSSATIIANGGWYTFGFKGGTNRQVWVDSSGGNDSNTCLSFAQRCATYDHAFTVWQNGPAAPGDQLMIAGTGGRSYSDSITNTCCYGVTNFSNTGATAQYPYAVLSYDPADPTNAAKYGKLVGPDMPVLNIGVSGATASLAIVNGNKGYLAIQGIEIRGRYTGIGSNNTNDGLSYGNNTGTHSYIVFQNDRLINTSLGFLGGQHIVVSKVGYIGGANLYADIDSASGDCHDITIQDSVFAHVGWGVWPSTFSGVTASRDDPQASGGALAFSHTFYIHAGCLNVRMDRVVSVDSSNEGIASRSGLTGNQLAVIDGADAFSISKYNVDQTEQPAGFTVQLDDGVAMGGEAINYNTGQLHGIGGEAAFTGGSYVRNFALFDNGNRANISGLIDFTHGFDGLEISSSLTLDKISTWNYSTGSGDIGFIDGRYTTHLAQTVSNSVFENAIDPTLAHGCCGVGSFSWASTLAGSSITNTTTRSVAPAGYKTKNQVLSALGFSSKAAFVNMAVYRPDLPWAGALLTVALPAMGLTPQFASTSVPNTTGITPPTYYATALGTLSLSTTAFTHGVSSTATINGTSANFALSSSDLPSGCSILGTVLTCNVASAGVKNFHVTETSSDTLGSNTTALSITVS